MNKDNLKLIICVKIKKASLKTFQSMPMTKYSLISGGRAFLVWRREVIKSNHEIKLLPSDNKFEQNLVIRNNFSWTLRDNPEIRPNGERVFHASSVTSEELAKGLSCAAGNDELAISLLGHGRIPYNENAGMFHNLFHNDVILECPSNLDASGLALFVEQFSAPLLVDRLGNLVIHEHCFNFDENHLSYDFVSGNINHRSTVVLCKGLFSNYAYEFKITNAFVIDKNSNRYPLYSLLSKTQRSWDQEERFNPFMKEWKEINSCFL